MEVHPGKKFGIEHSIVGEQSGQLVEESDTERILARMLNGQWLPLKTNTLILGCNLRLP
jgi:hypothetical protein